MADQDDDDLEFEAIRSVTTALKRLPDDEARQRVLQYAAARWSLAAAAPTRATAKGSPQREEEDGAVDDTAGGVAQASPAPAAARSFKTFAELFDATGPQSNGEKALVAGYWLQVCQGAESFSGQAANTELKHLGEAIANITTAVDNLKNQKPALALQLKKSGKSQQARKAYKITVAGERAVEAMLNG